MRKIVIEGFVSLDQQLRTAIKEKFGDRAWVVDFSTNEVVLEKPGEVGASSSAQPAEVSSSSLVKLGYKVENGTVTLDGEPTPVKRVVSYEGHDPVTREMLKGREWLKEHAKDNVPE